MSDVRAILEGKPASQLVDEIVDAGFTISQLNREMVTAAAEITRLRAELSAAREAAMMVSDQLGRVVIERDAAVLRATRAEERAGRLEAALRPFAEITIVGLAPRMIEWPDDVFVCLEIRLGDLRAASTALATPSEQP